MQFCSYKPAPPLSDFIDNFWLYEGYEGARPPERILPSGTFELVFNLSEPQLRIYKPAQPNHNSGVEGSSPSLSTNDLCGLSITRRKVGVEDSWDSAIRFAAANSRPVSAAL
jgi:hypothetical protein